MLKSIFPAVCFICICLFCIVNNTAAAEITAASCSDTDLQQATNQVLASGGGIVRIPAGECIINNDIDIDLGTNKSIEFIGAGINLTTLINGASVSQQFEKTNYGGKYIRFSNINFKAPTDKSYIAILLRQADDFRVDHCRFEGKWNGLITLFKFKKGLIDHCEFIQSINPQGYYGYTSTSLYQPATMSDEEFWNINWNAAYNLELGTENSVFVEDNTFTDFHTCAINNWASFGKMTFRHNTVYSYDGYTQVGTKSGSYLSEIYDNKFINTGSVRTGHAIQLRTGGVVYNNEFENLSMAGYIYTYDTGFGYNYPPYTIINNLYIWNNTYNNCKYGSDTVGQGDGYGWSIRCSEGVACAQGGSTGHLPINEGDEVFMRAPQTGDLIYPYVAYTYPHPKATNDSITLPPQPSCTILGDLSCNQKVDAPDIQIAINVFLGLETDQDRITRSDINSDSKTDILDIQRIINLFLDL